MIWIKNLISTVIINAGGRYKRNFLSSSGSPVTSLSMRVLVNKSIQRLRLQTAQLQLRTHYAKTSTAFHHLYKFIKRIRHHTAPKPHIQLFQFLPIFRRVKRSHSSEAACGEYACVAGQAKPGFTHDFYIVL